MEILVDLQQRSEHSTPSALSRWLLVFLVHLQAHFHLFDGVLGTLLKFLATLSSINFLAISVLCVRVYCTKCS